MSDLVDKLLEQRELIAKVCELQRRLDMTERLMDDCVIILCTKNPGHKTVEYDEEDVGFIGKSLLETCYNVANDIREED